MNIPLFEQLRSEGLLSASSVEKAAAQERNRLFSVHWELKTILYLGVFLLSTGLGILVYQNIDTIGHQVILLAIALVSAGSFYYCFKTKLPFSTGKVASPNVAFDYILLLGCLTFISFIGYLQYQYHVFGDRFGLVTFIPMVVLFATAYYFDHLGILSMAITNLATWAGIAITPTAILSENNFNDQDLVLIGIALGVVLLILGLASKYNNIKAHFGFTYTNFSIHTLFISCLAGLFTSDIYLLWFVMLAGIAYYFYTRAVSDNSFYYLLVLTIYSYIGITYVAMLLLFRGSMFEVGGFYLSFIYFIASAVGMVLFLIKMNKKLKHDRV
jgi:hypothetical protein